MRKPVVQIARTMALRQPYARSGNVGMRAPACEFSVMIDGRNDGPFSRLRDAVAYAREYYGVTLTKADVYDPVPIPRRV